MNTAKIKTFNIRGRKVYQIIVFSGLTGITSIVASAKNKLQAETIASNWNALAAEQGGTFGWEVARQKLAESMHAA